MLHIKRILFPTDFSACAERAYGHAALLAQKHQAELHVLNVQVMPYLEGETPADYGHRAVARELKAALEDRMETLYPSREASGFEMVTVLRADTSADLAILEYADAKAIDLIVMGTHGRHGLEHFLMGSVAERVVRMADCPVLTVGETVVGHEAVKRILVPVDFSEFTLPTLRHASALAELYGAHLDVLHVIPEPTMPMSYGMEALAAGSTYDVLVTRRVLEDQVRGIEDTTASVDLHVAHGYPVEHIVDFETAAGPPDLIVIATHGLKGLKRLFLGSVTEKVVRMAHCPVFTVRSFGKSLVAPVSAKNLQAEAVS